MINLTITIDADRLDLDLSSTNLRRVSQGAATEVRGTLRNHFESLPGRSFWTEAARSTVVKPAGDVVCVSIYKRGVALQRYGGTIKPTDRASEVTGKRITSLLIPARWSPLRGKSLYDLGLPSDEVKVIPRKNGKSPLLIHERPDRSTVLGFLVKSATIKPHPEVMPTTKELHAAARIGAMDILQNIIDES